MSPVLVAILVAAALLASMLSAVAGVAGGVLLLSGLLLAVPATAVVPLHGAVQTTACLTRVAAFRSHARWDLVWRFALGVIPGSVLGAFAVAWLVSVDAGAIKLFIAGAILLSLFAKKLRIDARGRSAWLFAPLGFFVGALGMLAGSTGPIVTQALLMCGVTKEAHIATKSVVQALGHALKLPLFGVAIGFDFGVYATPLAAMCGAVIVGTLLGKKLLARLSSERFVLVARVALVAVVVHLAVSELLAS